MSLPADISCLKKPLHRLIYLIVASYGEEGTMTAKLHEDVAAFCEKYGEPTHENVTKWAEDNWFMMDLMCVFLDDETADFVRALAKAPLKE